MQAVAAAAPLGDPLPVGGVSYSGRRGTGLARRAQAVAGYELRLRRRGAHVGALCANVGQYSETPGRSQAGCYEAKR